MGLRDLRLDAALTQLELAQRAGLSKTTIVNIEAGRIAPHPPTVRKIAAVLEIEPRVLMEHLRADGGRQNSPPSHRAAS